MNLFRSRELRINMDNYESFIITAGTTLSHNDLGYSDEDVRNMTPEERLDLRRELQYEVEAWLAQQHTEELDMLYSRTDRKSFVRSLYPPPEKKTTRSRRNN